MRGVSFSQFPISVKTDILLPPHKVHIYAEDSVVEFVAVILDLSEKEISLVSECVPSILPKPNIMLSNLGNNDGVLFCNR